MKNKLKKCNIVFVFKIYCDHKSYHLHKITLFFLVKTQDNTLITFNLVGDWCKEKLGSGNEDGISICIVLPLYLMAYAPFPFLYHTLSQCSCPPYQGPRHLSHGSLVKPIDGPRIWFIRAFIIFLQIHEWEELAKDIWYDYINVKRI